MVKWEYRIVHSSDAVAWYKLSGREKIEDYLNHLGSEGWEIVNLDFRDHQLQGGNAFAGVAKRPRTGQ